MNDKRLQNVLNECLERIARGVSVEDCLGQNPELARDLEPLLRMAALTRQAAAGIRSTAQQRSAGLSKVMQQWPDRPHRRSAAFTLLMRPASVGVALALMLFVGGWGTVTASTDSTPGDPLYAVKTAKENVGLLLTRSPEDKAVQYAALAAERGHEMEQLTNKRGADQDAIVSASSRSSKTSRKAAQLLNVNVVPVSTAASASSQRTAAAPAPGGSSAATAPQRPSASAAPAPQPNAPARPAPTAVSATAAPTTASAAATPGAKDSSAPEAAPKTAAPAATTSQSAIARPTTTAVAQPPVIAPRGLKVNETRALAELHARVQVSISFHERALASLPASDLTPEQKQRVQRFIEEQIEDLKVLLQEIDRRASGDTGSQPHRVPFDQPKRP